MIDRTTTRAPGPRLVAVCATCVFLVGSSAQDPASRPVEPPRPPVASPDRLLFFEAWTEEFLERKPAQALEHYRRLCNESDFARSDLRVLALIRASEIARDGGDEQLLQRTLGELSEVLGPRMRPSNQIHPITVIKSDPAWKKYLAHVTALSTALKSPETNTEAASQVQEARESLLKFMKDKEHAQLLSGPLFSLERIQLGPELRGDDQAFAQRDLLQRQILELERAGLANDPKTEQLRSQLRTKLDEISTRMKNPPGRRPEASRNVLWKVVEYDFDIFEARLQGDEKRSSLLENEVANLLRGTGTVRVAPHTSPDQKRAFVDRFLKLSRSLLGEDPAGPPVVVEELQRPLQRRVRDVQAHLDRNPGGAFDAIKDLRRVFVQLKAAERPRGPTKPIKDN